MIFVTTNVNPTVQRTEFILNVIRLCFLFAAGKPQQVQSILIFQKMVEERRK